MTKAYCISKYFSKDNIQTIREVCAEIGYGVDFFETSEEAEGKVSDAEVVYVTNPRALHEMKDLKWCHTASAGVDNFIKTGLFDSGEITLTNSSGAYGRAIAEHIIMVSLLLLRRMPEYFEVTGRRGWACGLSIRSITDSNIAIVGTGNLGSTAAEKFRGMGAAKITGFSRSGRPSAAFDEVYRMEEFCDHVGDADIVVMCVPDTSETRGLLSAERIAALPETAYVINVGRGTTIDQDALLAALNDCRIAGAALDVVVPEPLPEDHPLWTARNCIITPHISGDMGLAYSVDVTTDIFCENLRRYAGGLELINIVNVNSGY